MGGPCPFRGRVTPGLEVFPGPVMGGREAEATGDEAGVSYGTGQKMPG
jgi:hypothetical protein